MTSTYAFFQEFEGISGANVVVFKDEVREGNTRRLCVKEPESSLGEGFLSDWPAAFSEWSTANTFIDDLGACRRATISFAPISDLSRVSPQQQSSWFLSLLARILQLRRPAVADGPKALHRYVTVVSGYDPTLGQYVIFKDGLAAFSREIVAVFD